MGMFADLTTDPISSIRSVCVLAIILIRSIVNYIILGERITVIFLRNAGILIIDYGINGNVR